MIMEMYSIKDELNGYTTPIPMVNEKVAERYFKDQILGNPTMENSKEDFSIWKMGTFDSESGTFMMLPEGARLIQRGKNYAD